MAVFPMLFSFILASPEIRAWGRSLCTTSSLPNAIPGNRRERGKSIQRYMIKLGNTLCEEQVIAYSSMIAFCETLYKWLVWKICLKEEGRIYPWAPTFPWSKVTHVGVVPLDFLAMHILTLKCIHNSLLDKKNLTKLWGAMCMWLICTNWSLLCERRNNPSDKPWSKKIYEIIYTSHCYCWPKVLTYLLSLFSSALFSRFPPFMGKMGYLPRIMI